MYFQRPDPVHQEERLNKKMNTMIIKAANSSSNNNTDTAIFRM